VAQKSAAEVQASGMDLNGEVGVPGAALPATTGRRLITGCSAVSLQQTAWIGTNIYHYASTNGFTLPTQPDLKTVEVRRCGVLAALSPSAPIGISLPSRTWPTPAALYEASCLRYDAATDAWSPTGLAISGSVLPGDASVNCSSTMGSGTYTVGFLIITTTTTTATTLTATTATQTATATTTTTTTTTSTDPNATTTTEITVTPGPWQSTGLPEQGMAAGMVVAMVFAAFFLLVGTAGALIGIGKTHSEYRRRQAQLQLKTAELNEVKVDEGDEDRPATPLKRAWPTLPKRSSTFHGKQLSEPADERRLAVVAEGTPTGEKSIVPARKPGGGPVSSAFADAVVAPLSEGENAGSAPKEAQPPLRKQEDLPPDTRGELLAYSVYVRAHERQQRALERRRPGSSSNVSLKQLQGGDSPNKHLLAVPDTGNSVGSPGRTLSQGNSLGGTGAASVLRAAAAHADGGTPGDALATTVVASTQPSALPSAIMSHHSGETSSAASPSHRAATRAALLQRQQSTSSSVSPSHRERRSGQLQGPSDTKNPAVLLPPGFAGLGATGVAALLDPEAGSNLPPESRGALLVYNFIMQEQSQQKGVKTSKLSVTGGSAQARGAVELPPFPALTAGEKSPKAGAQPKASPTSSDLALRDISDNEGAPLPAERPAGSRPSSRGSPSRLHLPVERSSGAVTVEAFRQAERNAQPRPPEARDQASLPGAVA